MYAIRMHTHSQPHAIFAISGKSTSFKDFNSLSQTNILQSNKALHKIDAQNEKSQSIWNTEDQSNWPLVVAESSGFNSEQFICRLSGALAQLDSFG